MATLLLPLLERGAFLTGAVFAVLLFPVFVLEMGTFLLLFLFFFYLFDIIVNSCFKMLEIHVHSILHMTCFLLEMTVST